jgi:hypothetical protein
MEAKINKSELGINGSFSVFFVTTDWSKKEVDSSDTSITRGQVRGEADDLTEPTRLPEGTRGWPTSWILVAMDGNDSLVDGSNDILALYYAQDAYYYYFRIRVDSDTAPVQENNSWGIYIDNNSDCNNDFLIQENWTDEIGYWEWGGGDWNFMQNDLTSDIVRTSTIDVGGTAYGVIDLMINRTFLPLLDSGDSVTAFAHDSENVTRDTDIMQNPTDVAPAPNLDVTSKTVIPEFDGVVIPVFGFLAVFTLLMTGEKKGKRRKGGI